MSVLGGLFGIQSALDTITNSIGNVFSDIWVVALFVLIDVVSPYITSALNSTGMLTGVGGTIYANVVHVMKLQMFNDWKGKFMGALGATHG